MTVQRYRSNLGAVAPTGALVVTAPRADTDRGSLAGDGMPSSFGGLVSRNVGGNQFSFTGGPNGNPNYPCFAGAEILPIASTTVPTDLGSRLDFHHRLNNASLGMSSGIATAAFDDTHIARQLHTVAFELYARGNGLTHDTITTHHLPLRRVDAGADAVVVGGGTALDALLTPGGSYVELDGILPAPSVRLWFDPAALVANNAGSRVVRVGLRWLAWKDDSATETPGEGFSVQYRDLGSPVVSHAEYGNWLVRDKRVKSQFTTRWLGETNRRARGYGASPGYRRSPFTIVDLYHMSVVGGEQASWLIVGKEGFDSSQTTTYLDYVEMVVETVPERRTAVGYRLISNMDPAIDSADYSWAAGVEWRYSLDPSFLIQLTGSEYTMTVREAIPADSSDRYRATPDGAFLYTSSEAIGPSLQMLGVTQPRNTLYPQIDIDLATISNGILVGDPVDFDEYNLAAMHYDGADYLNSGSFWAAYESLGTPYSLAISSGFSDIIDILVDGSTTFTRVRLFAYPDELTADNLTVTVSQFGIPLATASVAPATVSALEPNGGDWREFELILSVPVTPVSGQVQVTVSSNAPSLAPWYVSAARVLGGQEPFGYPDDGTAAVDYAVVLVCEPTVPPAPTLTIIPSDPGDAACGIDLFYSYLISWLSDDSIVRYSVQRSLDGTTWEDIAIVDNPMQITATEPSWPTLGYFDYGTPWDVTVYYRLGAFRVADQTITYGPSTAGTPLASQGAVIGFSNGQQRMIYVPTTESGSLTTTWTDMTPSELVQLHGENYSRALQAPEDRGLSFTQTIMIARLFVCTDGEVEPLTVGQRSLSPDPYTLLLAFAKLLYVDVRFPGSDTRRMKLQLGGMQVRNQFGVYMAEISLTDVFVPELDITLDTE